MARSTMIRIEKARKLIQSLLINMALELYDGIKRDPVLVPAPSVKFGMITGAQRHIAIPTDQPQQKPDLFLPFITSTPLAFYPVNRHLVTQPVFGSTKNTDMFGTQTNFFVELPVHR